MSRNLVIAVVVALVLGVCALVLPFVVNSGGGTDKASVTALQARVDALDAKLTGGVPLKIAYLDAEAAFTVFTDAVKDLRQKAADKQTEIVTLQQQFAQGKVSKDDYQTRTIQLQVDLLQAQLSIDMGMIDKMVAAAGFADLKLELQKLRDEAQPVVEEMKNLVSTVRVGVLDTAEFQNRYNQVKAAFTQLDQLLTQAATVKIVQAAEKVAVKNGFDLVLRSKNVIVYRNATRLTDITDLVKRELATYL
jgi:Skp family chaperone for outer membrane proteins